MTHPRRPGLKTGSRTEFCVIADVIPGHLDALRKVLADHIDNPLTQAAIDEIGTLHEARFVLLDDGKRLMFCSSFDGTWDDYIDDFAATAARVSRLRQADPGRLGQLPELGPAPRRR